jgi:hypothetical protein
LCLPGLEVRGYAPSCFWPESYEIVASKAGTQRVQSLLDHQGPTGHQQWGVGAERTTCWPRRSSSISFYQGGESRRHIGRNRNPECDVGRTDEPADKREHSKPKRDDKRYLTWCMNLDVHIDLLLEIAATLCSPPLPEILISAPAISESVPRSVGGTERGSRFHTALSGDSVVRRTMIARPCCSMSSDVAVSPLLLNPKAAGRRCAGTVVRWPRPPNDRAPLKNPASGATGVAPRGEHHKLAARS